MSAPLNQTLETGGTHTYQDLRNSTSCARKQILGRLEGAALMGEAICILLRVCHGGC